MQCINMLMLLIILKSELPYYIIELLNSLISSDVYELLFHLALKVGLI